MKVYLRADTEETSWEDVMTRMEVARRPNLRPSMIQKLANDPHYRVRAELAANPNTPVAILRQLANDPAYDVRVKVAHNDNTPTKVLVRMAKHDRPLGFAAQALAHRKDAPVEMLEWMGTIPEAPKFVKFAVISNPNTPRGVLTSFAKDPDWEIRRRVCTNPNLPIPVLQILAKDRGSIQVRRVAEALLEQRQGEIQ